MKELADLLIVTTRNYLSLNNCDILCLQETWHLDDNIQYFNKIHTDYLFTAISGVNSKNHILPVRLWEG